MADVESIVGRILIMPEFLARARVGGPDVVRRSHIKHAVRKNRGSLDLILPGLKTPNLLELSDVVRCDFGKAGMTPPGIVAVESEPGVHSLCEDAWPGHHCRE